MSIQIQFPPWEDVGTLPPQGLRNFIPGTYAKAKYLDALMDRNYKDHFTFKEMLEKYGTATRLFFDDLKTLVGTPTGQPPGVTVVGPWPCWAFSGVPLPGGKVEELYAYVRLAGTMGAVKLEWTTPDHTGKRVVWGLGIQGLPVGGSLESGESTAVQTATAATQANVRNETVFEFGPLASADQFVAIRIFRDAASANDDGAPVCLFGIEVVIV